MTTVIHASAVTASYKDHQALDQVDLTALAGEIHALVGFNGAGKSTLMKVLTGMLPVASGTVHVLGAPVDQVDAHGWQHVGHTVGGAHPYPDLTVEENLDLAAALHLMPPTTARTAIDTLVARLDLTSWRHTPTARLSTGNARRVQLARALVARPQVLLLDEPTTALDPRGVVLVREVLDDARRDGCGILISSHHLDEVARTADRISVIHQGRIVGHLSPGTRDLERAFFEMVHTADTAIQRPSEETS